MWRLLDTERKLAYKEGATGKPYEQGVNTNTGFCLSNVLKVRKDKSDHNGSFTWGSQHKLQFITAQIIFWQQIQLPKTMRSSTTQL